MGPLVANGTISAEWNFVIALLIGIAFGYILEASGFSSSKKLAGVFYGYDFVVLRVFFTAAITSMTGLIYFSYLGWINLELVYINPLFVQSSIIGGVIMGAGFITGGFCPGTGMCAAAIGKIDAIVFTLGSFIGVLLFSETYSLWEKIYKGSFLGAPKVFDSIGMTQGLFAFLMIAMAIGAFWVTSIIEKRVNSK